MAPSKILAAILPNTHSSQVWVQTGTISYVDIAIVIMGVALIAATIVATTKFVKKWN